MLIPEDLVEQIREANNIVDVVSEFVSLKKKGKNYVGLCPFHNEKTPSFMVNEDKQIYHCFGCGEGGNVISFIMRYRNMGFVDAVKLLGERANIAIPERDGSINREQVDLKQKIYEINREAARYYYVNLQKNTMALNYFKNRGISGEIIKKFGLGYSPEGFSSIQRYLKSKGYSLDLIEQSGLIIKRQSGGYYDRFRNRVMFPVFDSRGRVVGFGGRVLDNSKPKYLNSPETPVFNKGRNLYAINFMAKSNTGRKAIIVEGYMDVIALHQYGITNAVASLGTAMTKEQARLLKRYSDMVIICYDADTAGQAATLRGLDILAEAGCQVGVINIPSGKDPDEFIRAEGKEAFLSIMEASMPLVEYKIKRKSENFDVSTTEGKIGFIKASAGELSKINDPIVVDAYISKLSSETGIAASAMYDELSRQKNYLSRGEDDPSDRHINGKSRYNNNIDGQKLYLEPAFIKAEKLVLQILYINKDSFSIIIDKLSCEDFNDITYKKIACIMYKKLKDNEEINPSYIVSLFETTEGMKKAAEIFNGNSEGDINNIDEVINDCINIIKRCRLMSKRDSLVSEMRECEEKGDVEQSTQLLKEIMGIERQLKMH